MRTTPQAVKGVLLNDYDGKRQPDLTPFLATASALVDRAEVYAAENDVPTTAASLELLERWLAAHCYAVSDRPYTSENTEGTSGTFDGKTGQGLDATLYGQTAKLLDVTGYLATVGVVVTAGGRPKASLTWLGS